MFFIHHNTSHQSPLALILIKCLINLIPLPKLLKFWFGPKSFILPFNSTLSSLAVPNPTMMPSLHCISMKDIDILLTISCLQHLTSEKLSLLQQYCTFTNLLIRQYLSTRKNQIKSSYFDTAYANKKHSSSPLEMTNCLLLGVKVCLGVTILSQKRLWSQKWILQSKKTCPCRWKYSSCHNIQQAVLSHCNFT